MAFLIPADLVLLVFVKKLTVIGMSGNTQGVKRAASPKPNPIRKINNNPSSSFSSELESKSSLSSPALSCEGNSLHICLDGGQRSGSSENGLMSDHANL